MKNAAKGALALLILLASCSGNGNKKDSTPESAGNAVEFETYTYDLISEVAGADSIDNSDGSRYCHVVGEATLPVKIGNRDVTALRDSLMRLGAVTLVSAKEVAPVLDPEMKLTKLSPDSVEACSSYSNTLVVSLLTSRMVVWKDYASSYICKAAHGSYSTTYVNYSIADNKILSLPDLFKPGYEKPLAEMIRQRLVDEKVDLIVPVDQVGLPSDFRITSTGITFIYGIYEIAPYSSGEVTVSFDGYELESILAPDTLGLIYGPSAD